MEIQAPRVRVFASLHYDPPYDSIPYEVQAEELLKMGADGFKLIEMKPNVRNVIGKGVNHESYDAFFSLLEDRGIPVTLHVADPSLFWDASRVSQKVIDNGWFYGCEGFMPYEEYYREVFEMLDKHPRLNIILAHFFFLDENYNEAVRVMEKYPKVCFDLTPHGGMYLSFAKDPDRWREFFIKYQDRILLGTDGDNVRCTNGGIYEVVLALLRKETPEFPMPSFYRDTTMKTLSLSDTIAEKITRGNFLRLTGDTPRPLNVPLIMENARKLLAALDNLDGKNKIAAEWLREFCNKYQ